jgi:hypothetical protein
MWSKLKSFAEALLKVGPIILTIVSILTVWLGFLTFSFNRSKEQVSNQFAAQQAEQAKQAEETRTRIAEAQAKLQQSQFAASLIPLLAKGSDQEKKLALDLLCGVDQSLCTRISKVVTQSDSNGIFRQYAILGLAKKGDPSARSALLAIEQQGQTPTEREDAKRGAEVLTNKLRFNLSQARNFYEVGRWREAAYYFNEASKFVSSGEVDAAALELARTDYEHGGFQDAARSFNSLFQSFGK